MEETGIREEEDKEGERKREWDPISLLKIKE